jgi:hypothetical protein
MFERTKSLSHVTQFAQRGVELFRLHLSLRLRSRGALAAATDEEDDQKDGDGRQCGEDSYHGRSKGKEARPA